METNGVPLRTSSAKGLLILCSGCKSTSHPAIPSLARLFDGFKGGQKKTLFVFLGGSPILPALQKSLKLAGAG